jgi:transposase
MKHHVGLDVAQATAAIGLVDGEGRTLAEGVTATEPCAIAAFVRRRAPSIERIGHRAGRASSGSGIERIGMEAGPLSIWLWNERRALELPVVCMDARHGDAGLPGPA